MQAEHSNQSKQFLPEDLLDFVGDQDPFTDDLEQKVYYSEEGRAQRLNLMLHLAPYGGAMLLSGEKGVGKTALLYQFFSRLGDSCQAISLDALFAQSAELILQRIQEKVFWQSQLHEDTLTSLRRFLSQQRSQGKMLVLVIDNAHKLDDSALNMLASLMAADDLSEKQITLILSGEQVLKQRLAEKSFQLLQSQLVHSVDLAPFTEEETAAYIQYRLSIAGEPDDLKASLYKSIFASSQGVPLRINEFARLAWNKNHGVEVKKKTSKIASNGSSKFKFILPGIAVAVLLVLMLGNSQEWFGVQEINDMDAALVSVEADDVPLIKQPVQLAASMPNKIIKLQKTEPSVVAAPKVDAEVKVTADAQVKLDKSIENIELENEPSLKSAAELTQNNESLNSLMPQEKVASDGPVVTNAQEVSKPVSVAQDIELKKSATEKLLLAETSLEAVESENASSEHVGAKRTAPENDVSLKLGESEMRPNEAEAELKKTVPITLKKPESELGSDAESESTQPVIAVKSDVATVSGEGRTDETWLLSQQANHFTLQLMAMDEVAVRRFAAKNNLREARYFWTMAGGKNVLAVVTGVFQNRDEALQGSKSLSKKIPGIKPWVRTFASVQVALKDFQGLNQARQRTELYAEHESQLLALDPKAFTLQLMAMEEHKVLSFVSKNSLGEDMRYFRTASKNQPLLALVLGVYKNRVDAQQSAALLQKRLPGVTPWLRQLASVQQVIGVSSASKE